MVKNCFQKLQPSINFRRKFELGLAFATSDMIPDLYFETEVQIMVDSVTFSSSPSPHYELCLINVHNLSRNCLTACVMCIFQSLCLIKKINKW